MGFLNSGTPLSWKEAQPYLEYVREHGIEQFIELFKHTRQSQRDCLKWGEEVHPSLFTLLQYLRGT